MTPFYNGECDGRYGRFHDWVHTLRDMDDKPFEANVCSFIAVNPDAMLYSSPQSFLRNSNDFYGTKRNSIEKSLKIPKVIRDLNSVQPDIVHITAFDPLVSIPISTFGTDAVYVLGPNIGGWYPNRRVNILHKGEVSNWKLKTKFRLRKVMVRKDIYSRVIAFSSYHKDMLNHLGILDRKITTLQPGVDSIFSLSPGQSRNNGVVELLYVGKLTEQKGYNTFLKAIKKIDSSIQAKIVGTGNPNQRLIKRLGIEEQVTIEGFVDRSTLPRYYQSADLFVIPSIDEMSPNTQFEALACGTPIVATDTEGINEFVPPDASKFFWPRDSDSLAASIEEAISDLDIMTEAASNHASDFNAEKTVTQLNKVYRNILK